MLVSKKAEYAISALTDLASLEKGENTTTREIACRQNIPSSLIVQLVSQLSKAGWVKSTRGASGGVYLKADPAQITIRDVIEQFDTPLMVTRCLLQNAPCQNKEQCPLRDVWVEAQEKMLEVFDKTTVKDLARAKKP